MNKIKSSKRLLFGISAYALIYFILFGLPIILSAFDASSFPGGKSEMVTIFIANILFLTGVIICWYNEKIGGMIICSWHLIVWAFALFIWQDAGMIIVLILPMLYAGAFLIRNWYVNTNPEFQDGLKMTKLLLQILLLNYLAVYLLVVLSAVIPKVLGWELMTGVDDLVVWNYTSILGISLIIALILFLAGFILSWRSEFKAGIIFIIWYAIIAILTILFPDFSNSGPWIVGGLVLIIQGILYIQLIKKPHLFTS